MAQRTWGQMRMLLAQRFPVLSKDLLTSALQTAYARVLDRQPWTQLERRGYVATVARVTLEDLTLTSGSPTVTGAGFDASYDGRRFRLVSADETYTLTYVSATELTLDRDYEGADAAGDASAYVFQNRYALPTDCKSVKVIKNVQTGTDLERRTAAELDERSVNRWEYGEPTGWAMDEPTSEETDGPILQYVELYPIPIEGKSYPIVYQKSAVGFTESTASGYPLPWVSDDALLSLATAICCGEPAVSADPTFHLMQFEEALLVMVSQDAQRAPKRMRMDDRYTEHDRERTRR